MDELRAHSRIETVHKIGYLIIETVEEIVGLLDTAESDELIELTSTTGQTLFPTERLYLRPHQIGSVQEVSEEAWAWSARMTELHYARQLADMEQSPQDRMVEVQKRMVEVLAGEDGE